MTWPEMVSHVTPFHSQQSVPFFHVSSWEEVLCEFLKSSKAEVSWWLQKEEEEEEANMKYGSRSQQRMLLLIFIL